MGSEHQAARDELHEALKDAKVVSKEKREKLSEALRWWLWGDVCGVMVVGMFVFQPWESTPGGVVGDVCWDVCWVDFLCYFQVTVLPQGGPPNTSYFSRGGP